MREIVILLISLTAYGLTACSDATSGSYQDPPQGMVSIAHLKSLANDDSTLITHDLSIEGYVVANDLFGEFYKTIVISDHSGGIAIGVDESNTAARFPISARVTIHCSGLALGSNSGTLMLGAMPEREYTVDRIASIDIDRYIMLDKQHPLAIEPTPTSIAQITPSHIGNYVVIKDLHFNEEANTKWCDKDPLTGEYITTQRTAYDQADNTIAVSTIAQCDYRNETMPTTQCSLYGIVEYFNGKYSLRIVNHGIVLK